MLDVKRHELHGLSRYLVIVYTCFIRVIHATRTLKNEDVHYDTPSFQEYLLMFSSIPFDG